MNTYTIRPATVEDAGALRRLNLAFNGDRTPGRWVRERLADPNAVERVFVAVCDGQVVGFCCLTIVPTFCRQRPRAEVTELFVAAPHRRRGVARCLMTAAVAHAARANVLEFFVLTNRQNAAGRGLYESLGYVEGNDVLYRKR